MRILGIIQPHASGKVSVAFLPWARSIQWRITGSKAYKLRMASPSAARSIIPWVRILIIQVTRPSRLMARQTWPGWPALTVKPDLQRLVKEAPVRAERGKTPADVINVLFLARSNNCKRRFRRPDGHWRMREALGQISKLCRPACAKVVTKGAPVSLLTLHAARHQILSFRKVLTLRQAASLAPLATIHNLRRADSVGGRGNPRYRHRQVPPTEPMVSTASIRKSTGTRPH